VAQPRAVAVAVVVVVPEARGVHLGEGPSEPPEHDALGNGASLDDGVRGPSVEEGEREGRVPRVGIDRREAKLAAAGRDRERHGEAGLLEAAPSKVVLHPRLTLDEGAVVPVAHLQAGPRTVGEVDPVVGPAEPAGQGRRDDDAGGWRRRRPAGRCRRRRREPVERDEVVQRRGGNPLPFDGRLDHP